MTHNVLVYGTLRPGNRRKVTVPGQMFSLGGFPGVLLNKRGTVVCELVEGVTDHVLSRLDDYEGYTEERPERSHYIRRRFVDPSQDVDAWIYEYNYEPPEQSEVEGGDWLEYREQSAGSAARFLEQD